MNYDAKLPSKQVKNQVKWISPVHLFLQIKISRFHWSTADVVAASHWLIHFQESSKKLFMYLFSLHPGYV